MRRAGAHDHCRQNIYAVLAAGVLFLHLLFILWVALGAFLAKSRFLLRWLHIASLVWGIFIEIAPWSCPLTAVEVWLESRAGVEPYQGGFMLHYLDALVYPDISRAMLITVTVAVCGINLAWYGWKFWKSRV